MKIRAEFRLSGKPAWYQGPAGPNGRQGVRREILLSEGGPHVEEELVNIVEAVKPPGTEVFVSRSFGPAPSSGGAVKGRGGRVVIWLFDRSESTAGTPRGRISERRWKKQQLQEALARIGGRFLTRKARDV